MYVNDSFFTLSVVERAGLVVLSACLTVVTASVVWRVTRHHRIPVRLVVALIIYWVFLWLSPQIYYVYYVTIFSSLPAQIVIGWPPAMHDLFVVLTFQNQHNLSFHAQGVLGWALIILVLFHPSAKKRA